MRESKRRGKHTDPLVIVLSVVFCLGVAGATRYYVLTYSRETEARTIPESLVTEGNVETGTPNDPKRCQQELSSIVEEGMMIFSINATPFTTDGKGKANLMVEDPSNSRKRFTVAIQRDDTEEVMYKSNCPDSEQYIDEAPLDVELAKSEYACTVYLDAYRLNNDGYIGGAGARITLYVLE